MEKICPTRTEFERICKFEKKKKEKKSGYGLKSEASLQLAAGTEESY